MKAKFNIPIEMILDGTGDFARTQAAGAGVYPSGRTFNNRLYAAYIGFPGTIGTSVGVGYLDTERNALSADVTFSHNGLHLLFRISKNYSNRYCI